MSPTNTGHYPIPVASRFSRVDALAVVAGAAAGWITAFAVLGAPPLAALLAAGLAAGLAGVTAALVRLRRSWDIARTQLQSTKMATVRTAYLARATSEAVLIHDGERICDVNDSFTEIFGYQRDEAVDRPLLDLFEADARPLVRDKLGTRSVDTLYKIGGITREGTVVPIEIRPWTMYHDDGLVRALAIRDVSDYQQVERALVESERQLRHAQKMEAVGMLAAGVAHDFNNLLTVIGGHCDLLRLELDHGDPSLEDVGEIHEAARSAASLTRQLLAFSRKQVQQLEALVPGVIVNDLSRMLARLVPETITLEVTANPNETRVLADRGQLEQVIINLAVNARDAMPDGGTLFIASCDAELDETAVAAKPGARAGKYVLLTVRDTGCGIPREMLSKIFDPFFTTKQPGKGTGLGLSTVFGIVKQSGGYVEVDSEPGIGTCFAIYLPTTTQVAKASEAWVDGEQPAARSATILLVEDARPVRELSTLLLQRNGYTVIAADTGPQALALAEKFDGRIDLLITDVVMPEMSGPAVAEAVRRIRPGIKVLFMSGYAADVLAEYGFDQSARLLEKPFGARGILAEVDSSLRDRPRRSGMFTTL